MGLDIEQAFQPQADVNLLLTPIYGVSWRFSGMDAISILTNAYANNF
jgi:hypothetical protein